MFSATFPNEVQELAAKFLENYIFVTVGTVVGACTHLLQEVLKIDAKSRFNQLLEILTEKVRILLLSYRIKKEASNPGRV
jgi:superfamily II DNA/RNA helicase